MVRLALADKRAGEDLANVMPPDILTRARFSSDFNFYLGVDNNHGALNDLVTVVLHELGHGLNFQTFVNTSTGANSAPVPPIRSASPISTRVTCSTRESACTGTR